MMDLVLIGVGALVTLAVLALSYGILSSFAASHETEERLDALGGEAAAQARGNQAIIQLDRAVSKLGIAGNIKEDLAQADVALTVTEYLLIRGGVIAFLFVIGYLLQQSLVVGMVLGVVGIFVPPVYVARRRAQRLTVFSSQLPDVLDHLVGSLRAGYGLLQSMEWVSRQVPKPAGLEFDRALREVQLGRGLMQALDSMVRRIPSDDLALIVTAIKIQHETGGKLADVLETTAHTIRERVRIQREIQVITAQQRYSGYVLMLLPIGLAVFMMIVNPEYEMQLFAPGPTLCIPIGAAVLMVLGFFSMRRIINIEV
ncbi:MAG: type II secretion system F family protein [Anaerolineae bacterium]|nr:type II secretion system F family protein [Anaerolineae bacterium]